MNFSDITSFNFDFFTNTFENQDNHYLFDIIDADDQRFTLILSSDLSYLEIGSNSDSDISSFITLENLELNNFYSFELELDFNNSTVNLYINNEFQSNTQLNFSNYSLNNADLYIGNRYTLNNNSSRILDNITISNNENLVTQYNFN